MYSGRRDVALEEARHSRRASPDWPLDDDLSRGTFRCDCAVNSNQKNSFDPGAQTPIYSCWPCSAMQVRYT
jgi:hypothetical protein